MTTDLQNLEYNFNCQLNLNSPTESTAPDHTEGSARKIIDCSKVCFTDEGFNSFVSTIRSNHTIILNKSALSQEQVHKILAVVSSNANKGAKLLDEEGKAFGSAYTDWSVYNEAKQNAGSFGMRRTTEMALKYLDKGPQRVIDFGAGTGQDTIPLLKMEGFDVIAVDGDEDALDKLKAQLTEAEKQHLKCYTGPFVQFTPDEKADLLISSFTWPYRPEEEFPECWQKTIDVVKNQGIIAGHFFGPKENPDPGMTYHTEEELKELLSKDFEILWCRKELLVKDKSKEEVDPVRDALEWEQLSDCEEAPNGVRKIYGGEEPAWGTLFHVVARKKSRVSEERHLIYPQCFLDTDEDLGLARLFERTYLEEDVNISNIVHPKFQENRKNNKENETKENNREKEIIKNNKG